MRVSTSFFFSNGLHGMQQVQHQLIETQERISLGRKQLRPSEDPVATTKVLIFDEQLKINEQFQENIIFATNSNELAETVLSQIEKALQRVRELAIGSNASHLNANDLKSIAQEIDGLTNELTNLMNSKDGRGDYLFSGFQGLERPFEKRLGGGYNYIGDEGERFLEVSSDSKIAFTFSGKPVFVDVETTLNTIRTYAASQNSADSTAFISAGNIIDQDEFDAIYPEDYIISFNDPPTTYNVIYRDNEAPVVGDIPAGALTNIPYVEGDTIRFDGFEFYISGTAEANDNFYIESTKKQDILTTIYKYSETLKEAANNIDALSTESGRAAFQLKYDAVLDDFDTALLSISQERSEIGVNLQQLERLHDMHESLIVEISEFLSDVQDVDMAEAATTLTQESFILQASQASFARISQLTIFNYI